MRATSQRFQRRQYLIEMQWNYCKEWEVIIVLFYKCKKGRLSTGEKKRWPNIERSGFEPWPDCFVLSLGQDSLLSQCLSLPRCINGHRWIYCLRPVVMWWTSTPRGLGGGKNTPSRFMLENRPEEVVRLLRGHWPKADSTYMYLSMQRGQRG